VVAGTSHVIAIPSLVGATLSLVGATLSLVGATPSLVAATPSLMSATLSLVLAPLILMSATPSLVIAALSLVLAIASLVVAILSLVLSIPSHAVAIPCGRHRGTAAPRPLGTFRGLRATHKEMDLDANALLASLFIGLIGAACFVYGRRQGRLSPMAVGAAMVVYPYFVPNVLVMAAIAVALLAAMWVATRAGW
jgi:hypothetical protein